jgi:hypothetical protein
LALPDVDAGLTEIGRAFDELDADGVVLHSNFDGVKEASEIHPIGQVTRKRSASDRGANRFADD